MSLDDKLSELLALVNTKDVRLVFQTDVDKGNEWRLEMQPGRLGRYIRAPLYINGSTVEEAVEAALSKLKEARRREILEERLYLLEKFQPVEGESIPGDSLFPGDVSGAIAEIKAELEEADEEKSNPEA